MIPLEVLQYEIAQYLDLDTYRNLKITCKFLSSINIDRLENLITDEFREKRANGIFSIWKRSRPQRSYYSFFADETDILINNTLRLGEYYCFVNGSKIARSFRIERQCKVCKSYKPNVFFGSFKSCSDCRITKKKQYHLKKLQSSAVSSAS